MTKSKIFLGGSAFILAIAGAFASKASNKTAVVNGYYATQDRPVCNILTISCTGTGAPCTKVTAHNGSAQVFLTIGTCSTPLSRNL
jgi:hypothetical protein